VYQDGPYSGLKQTARASSGLSCRLAPVVSPASLLK